MMRALFAALSVSLLAGCAASSDGESSAEDLVPEDMVAHSDQATLSSARFECPPEKCDKAIPSEEPWWAIKRRPVQDHRYLAAPGAGIDDAAEVTDSDAIALSSAVTFHSETPFYVPPRVGGDADFGGHGPRTTLEVELHVFYGNEVWASVHIDAIETKSDWTRAEGTGWFHLYTAPSNIAEILSPTYFEHEYLDTNHAHDLFSFSTGSLVSLLDYVGDTKGNEAGTRTGVQVFFQPITVGLL
ncbi:hypothetical protein WMF27_03765 [Sorangium sp. So ce281]|uniref:hypothetical protein n=1 Tax=unclassified Sorangium TaxID=2621164 RepID=UPI003F5D9596